MAEASAPEEPSSGGRLARWPLGIVQNLVRAVPAAIDGYFRDRLAQHAAGIAYRVLFSLVPLTIVLVSIVGIVLHDEARRQDVIDEIVSHLPFTEEGSNSVQEAITHLASPTSAFGLVSLVLFFWASSGMMGAVRTGLEAALRVEPDGRRPAARAKLVDLILVAGAGALLLAMIAVTVAAQVVTRLVGGAAEAVGLEGGLLPELLRIAVPLVVATVVVMLLYRFVPARRLRFGDAVVGESSPVSSSSRSPPPRRSSTTRSPGCRWCTARSRHCSCSSTPSTCTRRRSSSARSSPRPGRRRRTRVPRSRSGGRFAEPSSASSFGARRPPKRPHRPGGRSALLTAPPTVPKDRDRFTCRAVWARAAGR